MDRLVLIDGHAILHRAYHALPPLTTSSGQMVNAVYGFTSMLLRVISELKPSHLAVVFDRPEPTFRNHLFKDYQIQRPKADAEFISQIDIVKNVVGEMGIPTFEKAGYEADDVIGTLAFQASGLKVKSQNAKVKITSKNSKLGDTEIIIVTGDRDILQLVDEHTKVYMPMKGLSESKLYGEKEVEEKFGIKTSQMVDYKALTGDPSDNYPGVSGIGPKIASLLLARFKTLEHLYEKIDEVESEKVRKSLTQNKEKAKMAKKLASIVTDVPIDVDFEACRLKDFDRSNVRRLFEELEFRSLIPRLSGGTRHEVLGTSERKKEEIKHQQTSLF